MPKEWTGSSEYLITGLYENQKRNAKSDNCENIEKIYCSYSSDKTMDLSTKWRAPSTSDKKPSSTSSVVLESQPSSQQHHKNHKSSNHAHMFPRKRVRVSTENFVSSCSSPPDVIILSDEEKPCLNGHLNGDYESDSNNSNPEPMELPPMPLHRKWDPKELKEKQRLLAELREELRTEEMKLVLLKKLHQSQMIKENLLNQAAAAVAGKIVPSMSRDVSAVALPPPLVRSGQQSHNKQLNQQMSHQSPLLNSSLLCSQNSHGVPPPLINQRSSNSSTNVSSNIPCGMMRTNHNSRALVTTPPNMVMGYNLQNLHSSAQNQISLTQANSQANSSPSLSMQTTQLDRLDNQTPAQRQAAAKLALRKQLEKTLLQIPPPKPPPPEMHFVPNANNQEFICLLGLDKVVDVIVKDPSIHRPPPEPFQCVQCATDFSPVWKWQDAGRSRIVKASVICQACVTSNVKKALKAEHTNRLKTAFVKALQQEQEIEQRMSQSSSPIGVSPTHTPCSTPTPTTALTHHSVPTPPAPHSPILGSSKNSNAQQATATTLVNSASLLQHLPKLSAAHQSLLHAQAQQLQHYAQTMSQPQPAHMYPFPSMLAAQAYSYQLLGKNHGLSSAELQRQYLLDMIPPRSLPQGPVNWKT